MYIDSFAKKIDNNLIESRYDEYIEIENVSMMLMIVVSSFDASDSCINRTVVHNIDK